MPRLAVWNYALAEAGAGRQEVEVGTEAKKASEARWNAKGW